MKPFESMWMPLCFRKPVAGTLPAGETINVRKEVLTPALITSYRKFFSKKLKVLLLWFVSSVCCYQRVYRHINTLRHLLRWHTRPPAGLCHSSTQPLSAVKEDKQSTLLNKIQLQYYFYQFPHMVMRLFPKYVSFKVSGDLYGQSFQIHPRSWSSIIHTKHNSRICLLKMPLCAYLPIYFSHRNAFILTGL